MNLDVAQRLELIEQLWDSIATDPTASSQVPLSEHDRDLVEHRLREHGENPLAARPWSEVRDEILKLK